MNPTSETNQTPPSVRRRAPTPVPTPIPIGKSDTDYYTNVFHRLGDVVHTAKCTKDDIADAVTIIKRDLFAHPPEASATKLALALRRALADVNQEAPGPDRDNFLTAAAAVIMTASFGTMDGYCY